MRKYTKQEIEKIDALVAKYIMLYPSFDAEEIQAAQQNLPPPSNPITGRPKQTVDPTEIPKLQRAPFFCNSRSLSLSIIDEMERSGYLVRIERVEKGWQVVFRNGVAAFESEAEKLGLAVCLAALKTCNITPDSILVEC